MKWRVMIILLSAIGMVACRRSDSPLNDQAGIEKEKLADNVIRKTALQLKQETGLRPCGTIGQMLNEIQILGLSFDYYQPVDIVEGRKLLIKAVDVMMQTVNGEERIHPYLIQYPFTPRNVEIRVLLYSPDGGDVPPGALWGITASEGMLLYKVHNPTGSGIFTVYKETYEEALARLSDPSLPLVPFQPDPEINQEKLARLRKGVIFVDGEGVIWHLGEDGGWVKK